MSVLKTPWPPPIYLQGKKERIIYSQTKFCKASTLPNKKRRKKKEETVVTREPNPLVAMVMSAIAPVAVQASIPRATAANSNCAPNCAAMVDC